MPESYCDVLSGRKAKRRKDGLSDKGRKERIGWIRWITKIEGLDGLKDYKD